MSRQTEPALGDDVAIIPVDMVRLAERGGFDSSRHADECYVCGRGLTAASLRKAWWVNVVGHGDFIGNVSVVWDEAEDLGWFPVGPECAKRVPRAFRLRLSTEEG